MKKFYPQLDGLRALSVFGVILSHGFPFPWLRHYIGPGFWGVTSFFVLSGFLITEILLVQIQAGQKPGAILRSFFVKRTLRIFPLYYLVLAAAFAFNLDDCRHYGGYLFTYTLNFYNAATGNEGRYLSHVWSLCVEEQFYLLWPFLLLAVRPAYHKYLFLGLVAAAVVFRWAVAVEHYRNAVVVNYRLMPSALDALGTGATLAYLKLFHALALKRWLRHAAVPLASAAFYLAANFFDYPGKELLNETLQRFCVSVCCFFVVGKAVYGFGGRFGQFLQTPWLSYLGRISYGIYLFHLLVLLVFVDYVDDFVLTHWLKSAPQAVQYNLHLLMLPVIVLITVLLSAVSFHLIEKPFLRLKAKVVYAR